MKRILGLCLLLAATLAAGLAPAGAQTYPDRPITIVVPLAAGSGMDALVRLYADKLQASLGKPVIVENRPGAALMLAASHVATAPADGYTLLVSTSSAMAINPVLYKKIPYKLTDFVPVSFYVKSPFILVVNPDLPAKTVPELIELAKKSEKPLSYSSPGAGVAQHLSMEYMKQRFGINFTHVPYRSTPQSVADIVANHVQLGFAEAGATLPLIRDGKLRALAVSSSTPIPSLPDVPPFAKAANAPDFEAVSWHMLYAPAATPKPIVEKLHAEMKKIMSDPEMQQKATTIGLLPIDPPSLADTEIYLVSEREKWGSLVRKLELEGSQ
ncbi:tripartite tricarboxylate transporter substrate binding protein [Pseudolabrys taiwanensis]|uniref:Tripartite tricarboxylate transporter substrate binding protein n=1 Tax=Pseudolabrys taiwanensis TaxID=331696 RepID=A0A345ZU56_9HYPH|nr:tripartite tricarboxylate transporter substrate binding protein [Pseudolabrys taiwanensis]AXK80453.1 tripartite tricarboxylate transporter substrate binding protein [Pseudolabrys taiwanensis]